MIQVWGAKEPAGPNDRIVPAAMDDEYLGPDVIALDSGREGPFTAANYLYEHVAVVAVDRTIEVIEIAEPGAETTAGVAIGDDLSEAERSYGSLRCGTVNEGSDHGEQYPACAGRVAPKRFVWFGGDPVRLIVIAGVPLQGVT
jgi:hypothetical protein